MIRSYRATKTCRICMAAVLGLREEHRKRAASASTCGKQGQRLRPATQPLRLSPACELGKSIDDVKGMCPRGAMDGGALVVVGGRENRPHGEGAQFERLVRWIS